MQQPVNYTFGAQPPAESFLGGFKGGYGIGGAFKQNNDAQAEQARQAQFQEAWGKATQPDATPEDIANAVMLASPEKAKVIQDQLNSLPVERRQAIAGKAGAIYSAARLGNKQVARNMLDELAEASKNSGDVESANMYSRLAASADIDLDFIKSIAEPLLVSTPEGMEILDKVIKLDAERTKAKKEEALTEKTKVELASAEKKLADQGLSVSELRAQKATKTITAENLKLLSDAEKAQAEAFKEQIESGLSIEDISKSSGVPVEQIEAARNKKQKFSPEDENKVLNTLRNQYRKDTGEQQQVLDYYDKIEKSQDNQTGDLALIFSFMRMLDPTSTVREGEFATAENTGSLIDRNTVLLYNKVLQGDRLLPEQRKNFRSQAKDYSKDAIAKVNFARNVVTKEAERLGLTTENLFFKERREDGSAQQQESDMPLITTQEDYDSLPPGTLYKEENGKTYRKP